MRPTARLTAIAILLGQVLTGTACDRPGDDPARRCALVAWFRPHALPAPVAELVSQADIDAAELVGSWDGWQRPGRRGWQVEHESDGSEWRRQSFSLPPGRYQYGILIADRIVLDEGNPQTAFFGNPFAVDVSPDEDPLGTEVSQIDIPDCAAPRLEVTALTVTPAGAVAQGALDLALDFFRGTARRPLAVDSLEVELRRGTVVLAAPTASLLDRAPDGEGRQRIALHAGGLDPAKYTIVVKVKDEDGGAASTTSSAFVTLARGRAEPAAPPLLGDGLLYEIMIDRFRGSRALSPPPTPGARAGGTLDGVRAVVESGYFERLGVTSLWLTPVYLNPEGWHAGTDGHQYEAYHGYWPAQPRAVDDHLGGEVALDLLVEAAHRRGLRVILDVVPNHVYEGHPYYVDHSRLVPAVAAAADPRLASWFNDEDPCICGHGCNWGERCWFAPYLPDVNWRQAEAREALVEDIVWWAGRFDLDGVRLDAVPMMPRAATRAISRRLREMTHRQGLDSLIIGEIFTGGGASGRNAIRSYLGLGFDGLDSAFDFPLMWALRDVVAHGNSGFDELEATLAAGEAAWRGSGAVMGRMIDNHDTSRFISEAAGDGYGNAWTAPSRQPVEDEPYRRTLIALAYVLMLPGLPVLYYGDEIGLAGGSDPDNRRVLPDVLAPETLAPPQRALLEAVGRLGRLRRCLSAVRHGSRRVAAVGSDALVVVFAPPADAVADSAILVLSRSRSPGSFSVPGLPAGHYLDALGSRALVVGDLAAEVRTDPLSAAVYIPEDSSCAE